MKFFCTDMPVSGAWKDTHLTSECHIASVYMNERISAQTFEGNGQTTLYFAFSTGEHLRVVHTWWFDDDAYESPDGEMRHDVNIDKIDAAHAVGIPVCRDWMTIDAHADVPWSRDVMVIDLYAYRTKAEKAAWEGLVAAMEKTYSANPH